MNKLQEYRQLPFYKKPNWSLENTDVFRNIATELNEEDIKTLEDIFFDQIDEIFKHDDTNYIDGFDEHFDLQNFYPAFYNKDVGGGSWVRVKTDIGYNVFYAKVAPQKRVSREQLERKLIKVNRDLKSARNIEKSRQLLNEIRIADLLNKFPHTFKFVKIQKTKSTFQFLLPHEYEIVEDIQLYTAAIKDKMNGGSVKYKSRFTAEDKDQIFYLQSRGIDKDTAVLLSKLKQVYFVVDVTKLFTNYMQQV